MRSLFHRVTKLRGFRYARSNNNCIVIDRLLDKHTRRRVAGLASIPIAMQNTARHRCLQISVGKNNVSRFTTQFLRNTLDCIRGIFGNLHTRTR